MGVVEPDGDEHERRYFVRDNGIGFDMELASEIFARRPTIRMERATITSSRVNPSSFFEENRLNTMLTTSLFEPEIPALDFGHKHSSSEMIRRSQNGLALLVDIDFIVQIARIRLPGPGNDRDLYGSDL